MPSNVNSGPQCGSAATLPPKWIDASSNTRPMIDTSITLPGRSQRRYTPISKAMGIVMATVNVPQGLIASALTTTSASTASRIIMIIRMPIRVIVPAAGPISRRIISPSELPSRRSEKNSITKSCTAPASTTPNNNHSRPGR